MQTAEPTHETPDNEKDSEFKYPRFAELGKKYPHALEQQYERLLVKIDTAWDSSDIDEVFSDLIIDRRGGRKGLPADVINDVFALKEFRQSQRIKEAQKKELARYQLSQRGIRFDENDFLYTLNSGDQQTLDLFIAAGFKFSHIRDRQDSTPLLIALKKGYTVCAQVLLQAGSDANAKDKLGLSPILISCGKPSLGFRSVTELLLLKGANPSERDPMGNTPLLLALSSGMLDIAKLLIKHGAITTMENNFGETAIDLFEKNADPSHPDYDTVRELLKS